MEIGYRRHSQCPDRIAMPATDDDTLLPFSLPSILQKKVTAAFDAGLINSDGGVLLLAGADKRLGLIDTMAAIIPDHRGAALITHSIAGILRARMFAIACSYPDAERLGWHTSTAVDTLPTQTAQLIGSRTGHRMAMMSGGVFVLKDPHYAGRPEACTLCV
jgi:hypothetical protein